MEWNHSICVGCWNNKNPHKAVEGNPWNMQNDPEKCCFCGGITTQGIYVRYDPRELPCKGVHG